MAVIGKMFNGNVIINDNGTITLSGGTVDGTETAGSGAPYDSSDGTEVFNDDFAGDYSGWSVYSGLDDSTTPTIDNTVGVFRTKANNPVIDVTTDPNNLLVQPSHTANNGISIAQDISGSLTFSSDWTIVCKASLPQAYQLANNGVWFALGTSLPGGTNELNYNSASVFAQEVDAASVDWQVDREDDGVGNITEWTGQDRRIVSPTYLLKLIHYDTDGDVYAYGSLNNGHSWHELCATGKDPASFTHVYMYLGWTKDGSGVGEGIFRIHYVRAYQSVKDR